MSQDRFCVRSKIQIQKNWERWYVSAKVEDRTQECWFVRPTVGYRFTPWLKGDVAYEFRQKRSHDIQNRALFTLTGTLRQGNLSVSVRERYTLICTRKEGQSAFGAPEHVLRSMLKAQYSVPETILRPYLSTEIFSWKSWSKARFSAGTVLKFGRHHSLDLFYMYATFADKDYCTHNLGVGYVFTL